MKKQPRTIAELLARVDPATSVHSVPRNDLAAAREFYERQGSITGDDMRTLVQLQDDPSEILAIAATWTVTANHDKE